MDARAVHVKLLRVLLALTLTCALPHAIPAPQSHADAVSGLAHAGAATRAEALAWLAAHGSMADQPLLLARLRDENLFVRGHAEQALWLLWGRSGDAAIDRLMAEGVERMQAARFKEAIATFGEVIRRKPAFAEGWNKRATVHFLAGDYQRSLADCDEVMKRNPYHFGALAGYGQIHFALEQYEKALAYWRRALQVNPNLHGVETNIESLQQLLKDRRARSI